MLWLVVVAQRGAVHPLHPGWLLHHTLLLPYH
jgi:hypothetical protein